MLVVYMMIAVIFGREIDKFESYKMLVRGNHNRASLAQKCTFGESTG